MGKLQTSPNLEKLVPGAMASRLLGGRLSSSRKSSASELTSAVWFESLFDAYKDPDEQSVCPEGVERLCQALELDPSDVLVLVFAWKLGAKRMGYFLHEEWLAGCKWFGGTSSMSELCERLKVVHEATLSDSSAMRNLHSFTHKFCREDERVRNIEIGSAVIMLQLLHGMTYPAHVKSLVSFLESNASLQKRGVSHDEWMMILQFFREVQADCSDYQDDGAWPVLLDEYVEWYHQKNEQ